MNVTARPPRVALGVLAATALVPTAALAGKKVVSGQQSLQVSVSLQPAKARATGVVEHLHAEYRYTKNPAAQVPYNTASISLVEPQGFVLHAKAVPQCKESVVIAAPAGAAVCSSTAKVGSGSVVVNARPTIASLVTGKVTAYNGVDDSGAEGFPKGSPVLFLYVATSLGLNETLPFHVVTAPGGATELLTTVTKPAKPGVQPGSFTIRTIDLRVSGSGRANYLSDPRSCRGSWPFALTVKNFFGKPSVTAKDTVKCRK